MAARASEVSLPHPSVVGKVIAMGLAEWQRHDGTKRAVLTEAGEAKVAALRP